MKLKYKLSLFGAVIVFMRRSGLWQQLPRKIRLTAIAAAVLALLKKISAPHPYPENRPPGSIENYPFIGSMHLVGELQRRTLSTTLKLVRNTSFRAFEALGLGGSAFQVITDPADFRHMLKDNWENYLKHDTLGFGLDVTLEELLGTGIFAADGDQWRIHRKAASHLFSTRNLNIKMGTCFNEHARQLVSILDEKVQTGETFDFQLMMSSLTFDTMCEIAFGHSPGTLEQSARGVKSKFLEAFDNAQSLGVLRIVTLPLIWKLKRFLNRFVRFGSEAEFADSIQVLNAYVNDIVCRRRNEILREIEMNQKKGKTEAISRDGDLLTLFIKAALDNPNEEERKSMLSTEYLRDMVINFMVAGRDTTSCTLTNFIKLTSKTPSALEKLREEFEETIIDGKPITAETVKYSQYADACFLETLRMFPPVGNDLRFAQNSDIMPSGFKVRKGAKVVICNLAAGRNPNVYKDPEEFLPERWIPKGEEERKMFAQSSQGAFQSGVSRIDEYAHPVFWGGPRVCLGREMARLEVKIIAAYIIPAFEFEVQPEHVEEFMNAPVAFYTDGLPVKVRNAVSSRHKRASSP